jgi:predicted ribosome quality control (RQC) complex YloA/Tae2 family protein
LHLNYFCLRQLSFSLDEILKESIFINAFSFSKEELVLTFLRGEQEEFFITVHLVNKSCYLQFTSDYNRPKRNFLYQFEAANTGIVKGVVQVGYDRSFYIELKTGYKILFKLHGSFSNIILVNPQDEAEDMFRKELTKDESITLKGLEKPFDLVSKMLSKEIKNFDDLVNEVPFLDESALKILKINDYFNLSDVSKKALIHQFYFADKLPLYLHREGLKSDLILYGNEDDEAFRDIPKAYTSLARIILPLIAFDELRSKAEKELNERLKKAHKQLESIRKHYEAAMHYAEYESAGHLLMANYDKIETGASAIELDDFYSGKKRTIRLDKDLSALQNAERYYKKSKALKQDLPSIKTQSGEAYKKYSEAVLRLDELKAINDIKALKNFIAAHKLYILSKEEFSLPFRTIDVDGFELWIGKNAANNDLLTFKYAHKNDTWLHVKDSAGSHAVLRHRAGKIIGKNTIEKAAEIVAWHSKSRTQGLVPVVYTLKKFVMKPKGSNPGEVHLISSQTILVKPTKPLQ